MKKEYVERTFPSDKHCPGCGLVMQQVRYVHSYGGEVPNDMENWKFDGLFYCLTCDQTWRVDRMEKLDITTDPTDGD